MNHENEANEAKRRVNLNIDPTQSVKSVVASESVVVCTIVLECEGCVYICWQNQKVICIFLSCVALGFFFLLHFRIFIYFSLSRLERDFSL